MYCDLATFGHLFVIGAPRSGRSQLLRTLAGALAGTLSSADVHLYGIDAGGGALAVLAELPSYAMQLSRGYPAIPTIFGTNGEEV